MFAVFLDKPALRVLLLTVISAALSVSWNNVRILSEKQRGNSSDQNVHKRSWMDLRSAPVLLDLKTERLWVGLLSGWNSWSVNVSDQSRFYTAGADKTWKRKDFSKSSHHCITCQSYTKILLWWERTNSKPERLSAVPHAAVALQLTGI